MASDCNCKRQLAFVAGLFDSVPPDDHETVIRWATSAVLCDVGSLGKA